MSSKVPKPAEAVSYRWLFWAIALLNLVAAVWVVWNETKTRRPWKPYQRQFNALLTARGKRAEPIKIRQVTNPELGVVDRCETCHLGIDRAGFDGSDVPLVFRTHPRRAELLGRNHPIDRFGCTVCHQGQGAQTKGIGARKFDHGRLDPYWDTPMLSTVFAQSSCVGCHPEQNAIPGADAFNRGRLLFVALRCFGCHESELAETPKEAAPRLDYVRQKLTPGFVSAWLANPRAFRPRAAMPMFWPEPLQPNGKPVAKGTPAWAAWDRQRNEEIAAIVAFLSSVKPPKPLPDVPVPDLTDPQLAARGKALFDLVGCRGCHAIDVEKGTAWQSLFGPNLSRVGEKASARWLAAWLKDPAAVWPGAHMPNMRLSDEYRDALVAYLVTLRRAGAKAAQPTWTTSPKDLVARGRDLVRRYGCYGCHSIPGIEGAGKAGADLSDFGDKTSDFLAWGDAQIACDTPTLECWTMAKLQHPRWLSGSRLALTMPRPNVTPAQAKDLAVFVLAHRVRSIPPAYQRRLTPKQRALDRGEALVARHNCRGCHEIGRDEKKVFDEDGEFDEIQYTPHGGDIRRFYDNTWDAPPPLTFAGKKLQYPWIFEFLSAPVSIRPWLQVRMPAFQFADEDKRDLVHFFAARNDRPYPFVRNTVPRIPVADQGAARDLFKNFQCYRCHKVSGAKGLGQGELAPDLSLVSQRLQPDWVKAWLLDPQPLQPGTKMPTYFPPVDEDDLSAGLVTPCPTCFGGDVKRQIEMLTGVAFELGRTGDFTSNSTAKAPARGKRP